MAGMTIAEKILARAAGQERVRPGEIVVCAVDVAVQMDMGFLGERPSLRQVWDPSRVVLVADHLAPAPDLASAEAHVRMREFARRFGVRQLYDVGRQGISHQLIAEAGLALPGTVLANGDSHTCAAGAFNCVARGLGAPEMLYVLATGRTWYLCGPTTRFVLSGELPPRVLPRDVVHYIAGVYGDFAGQNLEYVGPTVAAMTMAGRQTIATMSAELSAEFALFEADGTTDAYLRARTDAPYTPVFADPDAEYAASHAVDVSALEPQVALPGRVPHNVAPVSAVAGTRIDQAFVGSCANGRLEDLAIAAEVVKGRKVHPDVRFIVTPSSQQQLKEAVRLGIVETLMDADAVVTNSTCGACFGGHMGVLGPNEVCLTASTRNFQGRMGHPSARIYLGSPATVAASAIAGCIADPRALL
jgi:3-isopropylmalate/(R)-2-methylmalate dehydratase large subunit